MAEQDVVESMRIVPSTDEIDEGGLADHVAEAIRPLYVAYEIEVDDPGVRGIISRELHALLRGN
jgi:hypothetical protein